MKTRYKGIAVVERKHKIVIAMQRLGSGGKRKLWLCDGEEVMEDMVVDDDEENEEVT